MQVAESEAQDDAVQAALWQAFDTLYKRKPTEPPKNAITAEQYGARYNLKPTTAKGKLYQFYKQGLLNRVKVGQRYYYSMKDTV